MTYNALAALWGTLLAIWGLLRAESTSSYRAFSILEASGSLQKGSYEIGRTHLNCSLPEVGCVLGVLVGREPP